MAKKCMINREVRRQKMVDKYRERRDELRRQSKDLSLSLESRIEASEKLQRLPRNSAPVRQRTRCMVTGRPRAVYSYFGLSRSALREMANQGEIPGVHKASW